MKDTWLVKVIVDNQEIIAISDGHISGIGDVSDYEDEIRECAKHLLGFIGELGQLEASQQNARPTPLTLFGMRVEIANWLKPGQWFIRPSRRG